MIQTLVLVSDRVSGLRLVLEDGTRFTRILPDLPSSRSVGSWGSSTELLWVLPIKAASPLPPPTRLTRADQLPRVWAGKVNAPSLHRSVRRLEPRATSELLRSVSPLGVRFLTGAESPHNFVN